MSKPVLDQVTLVGHEAWAAARSIEPQFRWRSERAPSGNLLILVVRRLGDIIEESLEETLEESG